MFVQTDSFRSLNVAVGETALIPCRPTSPNFTVELLLNDLVSWSVLIVNNLLGRIIVKLNNN